MVKKYSSWEKPPLHPTTGRPADCYWESYPDGPRQPRWDTKREKKTRDLLTKDPAKCWYSTTEASIVLGKDRKTITGYIKQGRLKATRGPATNGLRLTHWFINGADLLAFVSGNPKVTPSPVALAKLKAKIERLAG